MRSKQDIEKEISNLKERLGYLEEELENTSMPRDPGIYLIEWDKFKWCASNRTLLVISNNLESTKVTLFPTPLSSCRTQWQGVESMENQFNLGTARLVAKLDVDKIANMFEDLQ